MYTIVEPYINTPEATEGNVPFFLVKDLNGNTVYFAVTKLAPGCVGVSY